MLCGSMLNPMDTLRVRAGSNPSQRIIAAGIVIAFCYWAASVVMTLLLSVLLAYLLDPLVEWLEIVHVRRAIGAMAGLLIALAFVAGGGGEGVFRPGPFFPPRAAENAGVWGTPPPPGRRGPGRGERGFPTTTAGGA